MTNNFSIEEVKNNIKKFSNSDNIYGMFLYYKGLKEFIETSNFKEKNEEEYKIYYNYLLKLKFLSLNFFDDWNEIIKLLKNHFEIIYSIPYYDLWEKLKINLVAIYDLDERDKVKEQIKNALLNCDKNILEKKKYDKFINFPLSVKNWLKDYNVNLGIKDVDNLKRAQYLTNGENISKLTFEDREKIKILFDLYEKLKISSNSPKGFEEDVPMTINGKFIIFRNGEAEEVPDNVFELIKSIKINDKGNNKEEELKKISSQYPPDSLERRAIEEEIEKLKKT